MDQDLVWWTRVVFDGWQSRPGPRHQRIASAVLDAIEQRTVAPGARVPAERRLAESLGVSRGTVVVAFDHLVEAGVVVRRQGAGTSVVGRPPWTRPHPETGVASLLLRRLAADRETIDLSLSVPAGAGHLPAVDWHAGSRAPEGHGLDPRGDLRLRRAIADHLTCRQRLPTGPDEVLVTAGAQQALALLGRALVSRATTVVAGCPTYPGFAAAFLPAQHDVRTVPVDDAGTDPTAIARALHGRGDAVVYVMPTGHNPTGSVMPAARRRAVAEIATTANVTIVEDLALADLVLDGDDVPEPIAARSSNAVVIGSVSKLMWAGVRIGWIRADPRLLDDVARVKVAHDLATSAPAQAVATALLDAIDDEWLAAHRRALAARRDHLLVLIAEQIPAWRARRPSAGLSLWVEIPVARADAFAHVAAAQGVVVAAGSTACLDGRHVGAIRLSFAEPIETLELAVERLASAWESHSVDLATAPREAGA
ncbi:MAG TPA: PLP-dependent aminotransferase family protein [Acidimicrobiia bacterium]|nr:PLP-dependent aminotransferase family protein [Acidimicrobiia bacterium]